jgi:hypothetical protein
MTKFSREISSLKVTFQKSTALDLKATARESILPPNISTFPQFLPRPWLAQFLVSIISIHAVVCY